MKKTVGRSIPRKEGVAKVTGRSKYIDDITMPDSWYGVTVRSPVARGMLQDFRLEGDLPWNEITVVTAKDIPGKNLVFSTPNQIDQPFLVEKEIKHAEEAILLLAHPDKHLLEKARLHVKLDITPLPPILSLDDAKQTIKQYLLEKGNIDAAWKEADFVVEADYETGAQEQLYIETHGVIATYDRERGVTVWGSMQCPYYVHKALLTCFGLPAEKIRIIQTETGGGFGGKEDYPSMIAGHAALLAMKTGKPIKIIYDRAEDMAATTKRHPSKSRYKVGVTKEGKLVALEVDFTIDGGAYITLSPVVLSRGTLHAAGPYLWPNVRIRSKAMFTNTPPHGAFRGFGAPQSIFALERHMDKVAKTVGLAPEEFRARNFLQDGDLTSTGQTVKEKVDLKKLLKRGLKEAEYHRKKREFTKSNAKSSTKRGMGFATFYHGAGFTGSGEQYLASVVGLEGTKEGRFRILSANTEIGQGTNTVFSQIAADTLGLEIEDVEVAQPDTAQVPNSGPTVASRTTMVVGKLVEQAAVGLREILIASGALKARHKGRDLKQACRKYVAKHGSLKVFTQYKPPGGILWDDKTYRGDAYGSYAWAVYVAEVSVDTLTWEAHVEDFVALQEVGKVIHPVLAAGQIEGGVAQGVGYALYENVVWKDGKMANNRMTNYIMPTAVDVPTIRVFFEESPYQYGPSGAKGIGELPIDGPAPAILNAIEDAIGVAVNQIPLTPEILWRAARSGS